MFYIASVFSVCTSFHSTISTRIEHSSYEYETKRFSYYVFVVSCAIHVKTQYILQMPDIAHFQTVWVFEGVKQCVQYY